MAASDAGQLVRVDLARGHDPVNPGRWIVVEEQFAVQGDPPGQLERGVVEYQKIDAGRQKYLEGLRCTCRPPRRGGDHI